VFQDAFDVGSGWAFDEVGQAHTRPSHCHILVAGTSCKDFSLLNNSPKDWRHDLFGSSSCRTLHGFLAYIQSAQPGAVILENVAAMAFTRKGVCPINQVVQAMQQLGYAGAYKILDTRFYGLAQRRHRLYAVFLHGRDPNLALEVATKLQCRSLPLSAFFQAPAGRGLGVRGQPRAWGRAEEEHRRAMLEHNVTEADLEKVLVQFPCLQDLALTERERQCLAIKYVLYLRAGKNPNEQAIVLQTDQSLLRMPEQENKVPCLVPKGRYWVTSIGRFLNLNEMLWLQGIGPEERSLFRLHPDSAPDKLLRDLTGNACSATVLAAVLLGTAVAMGVEEEGTTEGATQ
jgi:site-specific DNA-cytosine methylase